MLLNASYYAFTATPKNKTLETFGTKQPYIDDHGEEHFKFLPFKFINLYSRKR